MGRCWCRRWCGGLERALGAALASGPNGVGELATRVVGFQLGVAVVKSPRLALERLQSNNGATLLAQRARGKSGRPEVWRPPGEKGAASRRAHGWAGVGLWEWCCGVKARRRFVAVSWGGLVPILSSAALVVGCAGAYGVAEWWCGATVAWRSYGERGAAGRLWGGCCVVAGWMSAYSICCEAVSDGESPITPRHLNLHELVLLARARVHGQKFVIFFQ